MTSVTKMVPLRWVLSRSTVFVITVCTTLVLLLLVHHLPQLTSSSGFQRSLRNTERFDYVGNLSWVEGEFYQRLARYEEICQSGIKGEVGDVYYHQPSHLSVCHVPKVGCTFWKRIFHFLYNDTGGIRVNSPFEINRFDVHFQPKEKVQVLHYSTDFWHWRDKALIDDTDKVLFVRDPYARLWSVYVDKFVLPDSWLDHGISIVQRRTSAERRTKACANDVDFEEFITYAVRSNFDPHWRPIHRVCNPCLFHPRYVGKMETFSRDTAHILKQAGLEKLVQGHGHSHYAREEVRMLTEYHFRLYETRAGLRACLTHSGVAARLWQAFVLNGYIGENMTMPAEQFSDELDSLDTKKAGRRATELLLQAHLASPLLPPSAMTTFRRRVMADRFRDLPRQLLEDFVDTYHGDFALFGYEARPGDILGP